MNGLLVGGRGEGRSSRGVCECFFSLAANVCSSLQPAAHDKAVSALVCGATAGRNKHVWCRRKAVKRNLSAKMAVVWVFAPRNLVVVDRSHRGTYCLHHQGPSQKVAMSLSYLFLLIGTSLKRKMEIKTRSY
jgi:hypothetical protein